MVVAVAFDCVEKMVYWSDITTPTISRASVDGGDMRGVITEGTAEGSNVHGSLLKLWLLIRRWAEPCLHMSAVPVEVVGGQ